MTPPRTWEDRSQIGNIPHAIQKTTEKPDTQVSLILTCEKKNHLRIRKRSTPKYTFSDGSHQVSVLAFSPAHRYFKIGGQYVLSGKIKVAYGEVQLNLKEYDIFSEDSEDIGGLNMGRIVPLYRLKEGLSQRRYRKWMDEALVLQAKAGLPWRCDPGVIQAFSLPDKIAVLRNLHFPENDSKLELAKRYLKTEELAIFQKALLEKKLTEKQSEHSKEYRLSELLNSFINYLPFDLTQGQKTVLTEILKDMRSPWRMARLLQGDVGSGKTVIALAAMVYCAENQYQSAIMVPTEILAKQHYKSIGELLAPLGLEVGLLTSSVSSEERKAVLEKLRLGELRIVVGTHALIQKEIDFFDLKLAVVDEQHRFGVNQREVLKQKGLDVDLLCMSATPIPQSLSLSVFGDLDLSTIRDLPSGRGERKSKLLYPSDRLYAYKFLMSRIKKGEQAYVVFPLIEENQTSAFRSLEKEYKKMKKEWFKTLPVAMLHGKLSDEDKRKTIELFQSGQIKVLFSTTVVEVGVHQPNATLMIVESAEKFGLSQLHQLRGRVGRSTLPGYVYVLAGENASPEAIERLERFCESDDGFKIAEMDLAFRGPGDFLGTRQSGLPPFRFVDLVKDFDLLKSIRDYLQKNLRIN